MRLFLLGLLGFLTSIVAVQAQGINGPPAPITKPESRNLPADVVTQRVLDQFRSILRLDPYPSGGPPPTRPLQSLLYWTVPHSTYVRGLCEAEQVIFSFKPAVPTGNGADTPTLIEGVKAKTFYHFYEMAESASREALDRLGLEEADKQKADAACEKLQPADGNFFAAENGIINYKDMVRSVVAFRQVWRAAQNAGPLGFECEDTPEGECRKNILDLTRRHFDYMRACRGANGDIDSDCHDIWFAGYESPRGMTIYTRRENDAEKVIRVKFDEIVTLGSSTPD